MRKKADQKEELAPGLLPTQQKLTELQTRKKSLEGQVETLRTAKEEAEKPEKEAKDRHQKLWEGMSRWPGRAGPRRLAPHHLFQAPCFSCSFSITVPQVPTCLVIFDCVLALVFSVLYRSDL